MIGSFQEILAARRVRGEAVGAFTCYEATTAAGVVHAAEARNAPIILLVSKAAFIADGGDLLVVALRAVAERAAIPACVQLDHVEDLETMKRALACGVGALMADGSQLPFPENLSLVHDAVELARGFEAGVEAELGHIEGGEDVAYAVAAGALTDPDQARAFVEEGRPDCLAVSIGNVHGTYVTPPVLDWARLQAIREAVEVPLSLHGASGLSGQDVRRAVSSGICKVNVNAELRRRTISELEKRLPDARDGLRVLELMSAIRAGAGEVVGDTLEMLGASTLDDL